MSRSDAVLNRLLDAASARSVMRWMSAATGRAARRRHARYARARAAMADLSVATRADLVRVCDVAADTTDAARRLRERLGALADAYTKRSRSNG